MPELFIGMTTWNDADLVRRSIPALRASLPETDFEFVVWDNASTDDTPKVLDALSVRYFSRRCSQGDALNFLLEMSTAPYTLLMHSDVFLLTPAWFPVVRAALHREQAALVSPEDTGLGPVGRGFHGMPESSFLCFDTARARACRRPNPTKYLKNSLRGRGARQWRYFDFYGPHVTHHIPEVLAAHGASWQMMTPLLSKRLPKPWYFHPITGQPWGENAYYEYGFGNFYAFNGLITHFHNWYAREIHQDGANPGDPDSIRREYCMHYCRRFLADLDAGAVHLPESTDPMYSQSE